MENKYVFTDYQNILFVYPNEVSFIKNKRRVGSVVTIYLREIDDLFIPETSKYIQAFYSSTSIPSQFKYSYTTTVSVRKIGHFNDEVKLQLLFPLHSKHHLLFYIRDINVEDGSEGKPYYAKIKLFSVGYIKLNGEYIIQIMKEMKEGYLSQKSYFDQSKMQFKMTLQTVSTIYPQNKQIISFITSKLCIEEILDINFHDDCIYFLS